jgi:hypothetical protein
MINNKTYSMKVIGTSKAFILVLFAISFLYSCKKEAPPVITTSTSYKGDITKSVFTPPASYSPFQTFTEKTISVRTYSNKNTEITLPADVSISYTGKFEVNSTSLISYKKLGRSAIRVVITLFSNDQVKVDYTSIDEQTKEETYYTFFGEKI